MHKRAFSIFIFLIVCVLPIIINPFNQDHYYHMKTYFLGIACFIMLIYMLFFHNFKEIKLEIADFILMGYFFLIFMSTIFSISVSTSIFGQKVLPEGLITITCYLFVYLIASKFYTFSEKHLKYFYLPALVISLYGIGQYFHFDPILKLLKEKSILGAVATIGNTDFVGTYFVLVIPLMIFSYLNSSKLRYLFISAICLLCLVCTMTRSAWLAMFVCIVLLGYFVFKKNIGEKIFIYIIISFVVVAIGLNLFSKNVFLNRFNTIYKDTHSVVTKNNNIENAGSGRIYIWKKSLTLIQKHLILGSGPDTFGIDFKKTFGNGTIVNMKYTFNKVHNEYLNIMTNTGIPSCILYLTFISITLYSARKKLRDNIYMIPIFCAVIGYLVQAFFNISIAANAPIFWVMLGILNSQKEDVVQIDKQNLQG